LNEIFAAFAHLPGLSGSTAEIAARPDPKWLSIGFFVDFGGLSDDNISSKRPY
jgi:hypothetical protein